MSENIEAKPSVASPFNIGAVSAFILRDGKVLLGERKGSHAAGMFSTPGGKVEKPDTILQTFWKELSEECGEGLKVRLLGFLCISEDIFVDDNEYFTNICFLAEYDSGEAIVGEPDKCAGWDWYDLDGLPKPLFPSIRYFVEAHQTGRNFFPAEEVRGLLHYNAEKDWFEAV